MNEMIKNDLIEKGKRNAQAMETNEKRVERIGMLFRLLESETNQYVIIEMNAEIEELKKMIKDIAEEVEETIDAILNGRSDQHCDVKMVTVDYTGGSTMYIDNAPYNLDKKEELKKLENYLMEKLGY